MAYLVFLFMSILFSVSQAEYILEKELDVKAEFFKVDQLGFLYLIEGTEIRKMDLKQNKEKRYSNSLLGEITVADVSDPFRTLLFYQDFNKIVFLDKKLAEIASAISLDDLGYYNVLSACQSINGGFWIFDQSISTLIYMDKNLKSAKKSAQLSDLIPADINQNQIFMLEKNDYIYLGIRGEGILLFDSYGTYLKTFPLSNMDDFQLTNEFVLYVSEGELHLYNTERFTEEIRPLPQPNCKQGMIENEKLFVRTEGKIFIYTLNNF